MTYIAPSAEFTDNKTFTFDDVQIIPKYSDVSSRKVCSTVTPLTKKRYIDIPLIASPMKSICEVDMAYTMWALGGVGIVHRFNSVQEQADIVNSLYRRISPQVSELDDKVEQSSNQTHFHRFTNPVIAAAIGAKQKDIFRAKALLQAGANVLLIDVAHGHHSSMKQILGDLRALKRSLATDLDTSFEVIAGNIATPEAAKDLEKWGADALRVGIGGGSVCETRIRTGVGIPQISCLQSITDVADTPIISCGGIRYPGDIAKALGAGASSVILGSMLSGAKETPGDIKYFGKYGNRQRMKIYHGSASDVQKTLSFAELNNIEGTATMVPYKGSTEEIVDEIMDGVRSAMSYVGSESIHKFYINTEFVQITTNGLQEAMPHLL